MEKKIFIIPLILISSIFCFNLVSSFSGSGDGSSGDPFQITNCTQLQEMNDDLSSNYILTTNINCSDTISWNNGDGFLSIGWDYDNIFEGHFDGRGYTISDLYVHRSQSEVVGLFGTNQGTISNVLLENVDMTLYGTYEFGTFNYAGGLTCYNQGTIDSCNVTGTVTGEDGNDWIGGLTSSNWGTIINSHFSGTVSGDNYVGGLTADNDVGTIINSYSTGTVIGNDYTGGLVAYTYPTTIENSYSTSNVIGKSYTGGLIGYLEWFEVGNVENCYATGDVTATGDSVGGLVGYLATGEGTGNLQNSYATGDVSGGQSIGGLVGETEAGTIISNCYAIGNSDATGYWSGGLIGYNAGTVENSYSIGSPIGVEDVGGLIGFSEGTVTNCFWDTETSGQLTSSGGTGKTTSEMKDITTFSNAGWEIIESELDLNNGYPYLGWQDNNGTIWLIMEAEEEPNPSLCQVLFDKTSPLNYPDTFTVWSNCDSLFTLMNNGVPIVNNSVQALNVGTYNFSVQRTDTSNYSNTYSDSSFVIVESDEGHRGTSEGTFISVPSTTTGADIFGTVGTNRTNLSNYIDLSKLEDIDGKEVLSNLREWFRTNQWAYVIVGMLLIGGLISLLNRK